MNSRKEKLEMPGGRLLRLVSRHPRPTFRLKQRHSHKHTTADQAVAPPIHDYHRHLSSTRTLLGIAATRSLPARYARPGASRPEVALRRDQAAGRTTVATHVTLPYPRSDLRLSPLPDHRGSGITTSITMALPRHLLETLAADEDQLGCARGLLIPVGLHQRHGFLGHVR